MFKIYFDHKYKLSGPEYCTPRFRLHIWVRENARFVQSDDDIPLTSMDAFIVWRALVGCFNTYRHWLWHFYVLLIMPRTKFIIDFDKTTYYTTDNNKRNSLVDCVELVRTWKIIIVYRQACQFFWVENAPPTGFRPCWGV